ncbi:unnamed protein product [Auanema sp. JU1783]|nr:unnamed protein product [Auanema sp. JU1783]
MSTDQKSSAAWSGMSADQKHIPAEEVQNIIKKVLDDVIGGNSYNPSESANWNQSAVENITKRLVEYQKPYKYIVTSSLLQIANGSGLNVSTISYWNKMTDVTYQHRWETKNMLAVVYVFAVAV